MSATPYTTEQIAGGKLPANSRWRSQLVGLRFCALSYLADDCQEDISKYI